MLFLGQTELKGICPPKLSADGRRSAGRRRHGHSLQSCSEEDMQQKADKRVKTCSGDEVQRMSSVGEALAKNRIQWQRCSCLLASHS